MKNRLGAEGTVETGGTHWMDLKLYRADSVPLSLTLTSGQCLEYNDTQRCVAESQKDDIHL